MQRIWQRFNRNAEKMLRCANPLKDDQPQNSGIFTINRPYIRLSIWCLLVGSILASLLLSTGWRMPGVTTELISLLPATEQDAGSSAAANQFARNFSNRVMFLVSSSDRDSARAVAMELDNRLRSSNHFAELLTRLDPQHWQQIARFYFPWRYILLNSRLQALPPDQLGSQLSQQALNRMTSPVNMVTPQQLLEDPLLQLPLWFESLAADSGRLVHDEGMLTVSGEGQYHVMISGLIKGEALSLSDQARLVNHINGAIEQLGLQFPEVSVLKNGMIFYAKAGADSARKEVSTIGTGSLLGIILLLWLAFRTWSPLLLCLLSVGTGIICGYTITWLLFAEVHVMTLVFGASLTGVSIDYAFHYMTQWLQQGKEWDPDNGLKHIFAGISLGLITSLLGYLPMLATPFPGLQQMAVFSSAGLLGAWLTVVLAYPALLNRATKTDKQHWPLPFVDRFLALWHDTFIRWRYAIVLVPALLGMVVLPQLHSSDDIRQLQSRPATLVQADEQVRKIIGPLADNRFFLVRGDSPEQLLQRNEQLAHWLNQQIDGETLGSYRAISDLLPSLQTQNSNREKMASVFSHQLPQLWQQLGIASQARNQALERFDQDRENSLMPDAWLNSPMASVYGHLWLGAIGNEYFSAVLLNNVGNEWQPEQAETLPGVEFIDKTAATSQLFARYRLLMGWLLVIAYSIITVLLALRYGVRGALQVVLPPLLAVVTTLSLLALTNQAINLFHILALIMVLGIGIDYTLFFHEAGHEQRYTFMAITLSAITTLLSFGLLALSATAAIAGFGLTVLIGITICYLLSPLAIRRGL